MENSKSTIILVVSIIAAGILGAVMGFFVFKGIYNSKPIVKESTETTGQIKSGTVDIGININDETSKTQTIKLEALNGTSNTTKICKYDLTYTPDKENGSSYFVGQSTAKELTLSGKTNIVGNGTSSVNSFDDIDLNGVTSKITLLKDAVFSVAGAGSVSTLEWKINMNYYPAEDAIDYENKIYNGTIAIETIGCEEK